jgi:hypothetical protein
MKTPATLLTLLIACFAVTASAQEKRWFELSGGASAFSLGDGSGREPYGWNAGAGIRRTVGVVAELSGYTRDSDYVHEAGIRFCIWDSSAAGLRSVTCPPSVYGNICLVRASPCR